MKQTKSVVLLLKPQSCWHNKCVKEEGCIRKSSRWWPPPLLDGGKRFSRTNVGMTDWNARTGVLMSGLVGGRADSRENICRGAEGRKCFHCWKLFPYKELSLFCCPLTWPLHLVQWLSSAVQLLITKLRQCYETDVTACFIYSTALVQSVFSNIWPMRWYYVTFRNRNIKRKKPKHYCTCCEVSSVTEFVREGSKQPAVGQRSLSGAPYDKCIPRVVMVNNAFKRALVSWWSHLKQSF